MLNITKDCELNEPIFLEEPFPILICDNFIDKDECELLIKEARNMAEKETHSVMGGRFIIPWQSSTFKELIKESSAWDEFKEKMPKKAFNTFNKLCNSNLSSKTFFKKWKKKNKFAVVKNISSLSRILFPKKIYSSYKRALDMPCRVIPLESLIIIGFIGIVDSIYRRLSSILDLIKKEITIWPLFEYNVSYEGYGREVHRDTDSRVFVCILYLNEIEQATNSAGGSLEIYEKIKDKKILKPQPENSEVKRIARIEPKAGRLVFFFNQANSYHAVNKMDFSKKGRHFIYGGFSLQSSIISPSKYLSKGRLPTNYLIYR
tara:strand:+ start:1161 stop:2114 length:954 start_codon:yes stop_codon:yes gene_type:complete